ncbi:MAG: SdrD B-like domain-containing protein [Phycisphaerae bacterium]|nr:SdrD B-like domain-containing protein [Phycisphaerae bacterium]
MDFTTGTFPVGAGIQIVITVTGTAVSAGTAIDNTATIAAPTGVTDGVPGNDSSTATITIGISADLSITKTDGVTSVVPGSSVTYTITASNAGPNAVTGATVTDTFPAALTSVSWVCVGAGGGTCTASGSGAINDTVNLPVGGSVTYTVSATVDPAATGTLSNTATVAAPTGVTDPNTTNDSATDTDTVLQNGSIGDLVWDDLDGNGTLDTGESGIAGVTIFIDTNGNNTYDTGEPSAVTDSNGGYVITGLAAGIYTVVLDTSTLPAGYGMTMSPTQVVVLAPGEIYLDADFGAQLLPVPTPIIQSTKTVQLTGDANGNGAVDAGDTLTYTVTITNTGTAPATTLVFTDTPDANTRLIVGSVTVSVPAVVTQDSAVTVQIASLDAAASVTIAFQVSVNSPIPAGVTQLANQGTISGANIPQGVTDDPRTPPVDDPTVTAVTPTVPGPESTAAPADQPPAVPGLLVFDPALSKVGFLQEGGLGLPGEKLTWEFTIVNIGAAAGTDVVITDTIVPELRIDGAATETGTYSISGQTVTFNIPLLNPGQTVRAYIYTTVLQSPLNVNNTVTLSGLGPNAAAVTRSAQARVIGVSTLPNTGYALAEENEAKPSRGPLWIAAGLLGGTLLSLGLIGRRLRRNQRRNMN